MTLSAPEKKRLPCRGGGQEQQLQLHRLVAGVGVSVTEDDII